MTEIVIGGQINYLKTVKGDPLVGERIECKLIKHPFWREEEIINQSTVLFGSHKINSFNKIESMFDTIRIVKV